MRRGRQRAPKTPAPDIGQRPIWQEKRWPAVAPDRAGTGFLENAVFTRPSGTKTRASRRPGPATGRSVRRIRRSAPARRRCRDRRAARTMGMTAGMGAGRALPRSARARNSGAAVTVADSAGGAACRTAARRRRGGRRGRGLGGGFDDDGLGRRIVLRGRRLHLRRRLARRLDAARRRHHGFVEFLGVELGGLVRRQGRDRRLPLEGIEPARHRRHRPPFVARHSRPRSTPDRAARAPRARSRPAPGRCRRARCARFPPSASPPAASAPR